MPEYRRANQPGGTFFFTLVTEGRMRIFSSDIARRLLRSTLVAMRQRYWFEIDALVLLPDHLHMIWTLPEHDADFSTRMALWKKEFTKAWIDECGSEARVTPSRIRNRRRGVWQRRFWEHTIVDDRDFRAHVDYIHYNPVRHALASCPHKWPYSSFHRFVRDGVYHRHWQCGCGGARPTPPKLDHIAAALSE